MKYDPWAKSSFSPSTKAEQNQKIVEALLHFVREETTQMTYTTMNGPMSDESFKELKKEITIATNTIKTIVERATGRPFKEIQSQPKVSEEKN